MPLWLMTTGAMMRELHHRGAWPELRAWGLCDEVRWNCLAEVDSLQARTHYGATPRKAARAALVAVRAHAARKEIG